MNSLYPETFVIFVSFVVSYSPTWLAAMPRWDSLWCLGARRNDA